MPSPAGVPTCPTRLRRAPTRIGPRSVRAVEIPSPLPRRGGPTAASTCPRFFARARRFTRSRRVWTMLSHPGSSCRTALYPEREAARIVATRSEAVGQAVFNPVLPQQTQVVVARQCRSRCERRIGAEPRRPEIRVGNEADDLLALCRAQRFRVAPDKPRERLVVALAADAQRPDRRVQEGGIERLPDRPALHAVVTVLAASQVALANVRSHAPACEQGRRRVGDAQPLRPVGEVIEG